MVMACRVKEISEHVTSFFFIPALVRTIYMGVFYILVRLLKTVIKAWDKLNDWLDKRS